METNEGIFHCYPPQWGYKETVVVLGLHRQFRYSMDIFKSQLGSALCCPAAAYAVVAADAAAAVAATAAVVDAVGSEALKLKQRNRSELSFPISIGQTSLFKEG